MTDIIIENTGSNKYSEMLIEIYNEFDEQFPESLTMEEVLQECIDAWNIASGIERSNKNGYAKLVKLSKYPAVTEKIIAYKLKHFNEFKNTIIDFSTENEILQVKSQSPEDYFNSILSGIINVKPKKK